MKNCFSISQTLNYSKVDENLDYRLDYVVSDLQKITAFHSQEMGVDGQTTMQKSNAFWVLSKLKLKILALPKAYDKITLTTFPTTVSVARFMREYKISDGDKDLILGRSEWCTLDCDSKTIRKTNTICYPFDMEHIKESAGCPEFSKAKEEVTAEHFNHSHKALYVDIDSNRHVNNVAYVKMALNCFSPEDIGANIEEFEIHYLSQAYYLDQIEVYKKTTDYGYYIEGKLSGKTVFYCVIKLK